MANTFIKLFQSILDSTVWQESLPTKVTWITMMAMADRDGKVWATVPGLARRAGVTVPECEKALKIFMAPDKYSRCQDNEGRRVETFDGGWRLLNHAHYRDMMSLEHRREYQRIKQAEYREARRRRKQIRDQYQGKQERFEEAVEAGDEDGADRIAAEPIE